MIETLLSSLTWKINMLKRRCKIYRLLQKEENGNQCSLSKNNIADQCFAMLFDEHES